MPEAIGQLTQLKTLALGGNKLTALPESVVDLKSLQRLRLHGNEGLNLPVEVLGPTLAESNSQNPGANPADILAYYFRTRSGPRPLNEAKLILVGRGAAGKTSIVNRLVETREQNRRHQDHRMEPQTQWQRRRASQCLGFWRTGDHARHTPVLLH